ncbi:MAG: NAD-dependent epimerase/dehydratase family protein [Pirellulaceae bacterium]|nr:NAD-dependent epimerase/dehydratase family protein [Pirellulaceae bacterium]
MSLLIVGCGYVGNELVRWLTSSGWPSSSIFTLTRTQQRAVQLKQSGVTPVIGDWLDCASLPELPPVAHVLVSVPHRAVSTAALSLKPTPDDYQHVVGLQNLHQRLTERTTPQCAAPHWIYLSTTGVYGQTDPGDRVDEDSRVSPLRTGARIAWSAERWFNEHRRQCPSTVLRLAGIYGPGRIPLMDTLRGGQPLAGPAEGLLNLIHVTDIARAIDWLITAENPRSLYLLSDGHPVARSDFYGYIAKMQQLPPPQFAPAEPLAPGSRRGGNKRVDASRFWTDSGLTPMYPDYRSGLTAIIQ